MLNASLKELSAALAQKKISGAELTKLFLDRISRLNGSLNAFITVDAEKSLAQAHAADERIQGNGAAPHRHTRRAQGHFRYARLAHDLRLEDSVELRGSLRCACDRALQRRGRGDPRQDQH